MLKKRKNQINKLKDDDMTYLEENVWEAGAEVGTINIKLLLARHVHIDATRAENFDT